MPGAIPFQSPKSLEAKVQLPHAGEVSGMLIVAGVTIIAGGGFHGKSTLLKAISAGAFFKVPGDGREFVVSDAGTQMVRAEDGRFVSHVDVTPFIANLPAAGAQLNPLQFCTQAASGSTSQAANVVEAIHAGARVLLLDEDTSAGNFLVRDSRMRALVRAEPIVPFIYRVKGIHAQLGISTMIVIGGCGDWLDVHDTALLMENYSCLDVTKRAHGISKTFSTGRVQFNGRGLVHQLEWPGYSLCSGDVAQRLGRLVSCWVRSNHSILAVDGGGGSRGRVTLSVTRRSVKAAEKGEEAEVAHAAQGERVTWAVDTRGNDGGGSTVSERPTSIERPASIGAAATNAAEIDLSRVEEVMHDEMWGMGRGIVMAVLWIGCHMHTLAELGPESVKDSRSIHDAIIAWVERVDSYGMGGALLDVESFSVAHSVCLQLQGAQGGSEQPHLPRPRPLEVWSALNRLRSFE
jgi:hypothetical protein